MHMSRPTHTHEALITNTTTTTTKKSPPAQPMYIFPYHTTIHCYTVITHTGKSVLSYFHKQRLTTAATTTNLDC